MNGVHDMGGLQGFGPVQPEANEPLFHFEWERRALAITLAMGATGQWNIDLGRSARESLPPAVYLASSYYEIWIRALEVLMLQRGLVSPRELRSGQLLVPPAPVAYVLQAGNVAAALASGSPADRRASAPARFAPGDRVRAKNMHPVGHTRLPRYVRGHLGTVQAVRGCHLFADRHASQPLPPFDTTADWLYTVVFDGRELWGPQADAAVQVSVDAWEPYLEAAT
ncbi:nitrile hydratase subunit beta [Rhodoferax sediminis]|jgi:nitrile hydratase|uniref:Nitrile hydratase subunit beta n=1 Tax=Rhodoferax sediminis TaxID=2509614 RepID=A0A515D6D5_9BURK|nr:nitrile hydratase subunit beta [Rhodoferax sediminis]QDL35986.1 nitrile hydratase subunit beta [Rhodoferax sediminis]